MELKNVLENIMLIWQGIGAHIIIVVAERSRITVQYCYLRCWRDGETTEIRDIREKIYLEFWKVCLQKKTIRGTKYAMQWMNECMHKCTHELVKRIVLHMFNTRLFCTMLFFLLLRCSFFSFIHSIMQQRNDDDDQVTFTSSLNRKHGCVILIIIMMTFAMHSKKKRRRRQEKIRFYGNAMPWEI